MTQQDYRLLASTLKNSYDDMMRQYDIEKKEEMIVMAIEWTYRRIVQDVSDACARQRPQFSREKFVKACGLREDA